MNLWALWIKKHQWQYEEIFSKWHPALWLCTSGHRRSPSSSVLPPVQNIVTRLSLPSSSSFLFSLPFLSSSVLSSLAPHLAFLLSGCENPAESNYGETKGRTWMCFPVARPAKQATRKAGSLSVPVEGRVSSLSLPSCSEQSTQGGKQHRNTTGWC